MSTPPKQARCGTDWRAFSAYILGSLRLCRISTESEFSPNDLNLTADAGKNYFVRQYIKVGGAK